MLSKSPFIPPMLPTLKKRAAGRTRLDPRSEVRRLPHPDPQRWQRRRPLQPKRPRLHIALSGSRRAFSKRCSTRACILDAELTAIDSDGHRLRRVAYAATATFVCGSSTSSPCAGKIWPAAVRHPALQARPRDGELRQPSHPIFAILLQPLWPVGRVREIQARGHRLKTPRPAVSLWPHEGLDQGEVCWLARSQPVAPRVAKQK